MYTAHTPSIRKLPEVVPERLLREQKPWLARFHLSE